MTIIYDIIKILVNENDKIDNNNDPTKLDKSDIQLINILLNSFTLTKQYNIKKKYIFLKQTLDNIFIENDIKFFFMDNIQKIQKIYFALNKFAFHYKFLADTIYVCINCNDYIYCFKKSFIIHRCIYANSLLDTHITNSSPNAFISSYS